MEKWESFFPRCRQAGSTPSGFVDFPGEFGWANSVIQSDNQSGANTMPLMMWGAVNSFLSGSIAVITFHCPGVTQFGPSGTPIKVEEDIWSFHSSGRNFQLGAGASATTGPMIRL